MNSDFPIKRIVLIHGAGHGAWCWDYLTPLLTKRGYRVVAPDLPGLGDDPTPPAEVTFAACVERVVDVISEGNDPVLLVGHSLGGAVVTQAAEDRPDLVAKLIYLAAFLPIDGESPLDLAAKTPSTVQGMRDSDVEGAHEFKPDLAPDLLYTHCDPSLARWAVEHLMPQAGAPMAAPVHLSDHRWGSIPKVYVVCTDDRAIPREIQELMCDRAPGVRKQYMNSDHSPFLSQPPELASLLHEEAQAL